MTASEFNRHYLSVVDLRRAEELLACLEAASLSAARLTGAPASGLPGRKVEALTVEITEARDAVSALRARVAETEPEIVRYIEAIEDFHTRTMFRLHYLRGMSWRQVAATVGGGNTRDGVKKICYRQMLKNSPTPSPGVPGSPQKNDGIINL